ncbi:protease complex subunit PrcB family protein [Azospirillum sp.]|uniref:protease complex subunit PrcB family protein n=1 Tax=Azospirillum sp. TaxID=34012 RepID=UPI002D491013|nr:protease complex subunit PrcB family protein [Azospirillum sp.]HYD69715.1 protease complex subunit PrcB family protein [Azospirillum sp.]
MRLPCRPAPALLLAAALGILGSAGCQTAGSERTAERGSVPADATPGAYWNGDHSEAFERAYVTARTPQEWQELWARVGQPAPSSLPGDRMAVAVFMGPKDTAGYAVLIQSAAERDGATVVSYREQVPGPAQAVALVRTSPYAVRLVPRGAGDVKYVRER